MTLWISVRTLHAYKSSRLWSLPPPPPPLHSNETVGLFVDVLWLFVTWMLPRRDIEVCTDFAKHQSLVFAALRSATKLSTCSACHFLLHLCSEWAIYREDIPVAEFFFQNFRISGKKSYLFKLQIYITYFEILKSWLYRDIFRPMARMSIGRILVSAFVHLKLPGYQGWNLKPVVTRCSQATSQAMSNWRLEATAFRPVLCGRINSDVFHHGNGSIGSQSSSSIWSGLEIIHVMLPVNLFLWATVCNSSKGDDNCYQYPSLPCQCRLYYFHRFYFRVLSA